MTPPESESEETPERLSDRKPHFRMPSAEATMPGPSSPEPERLGRSYDTLKSVGEHIAAGGPATDTDRQALLRAIEAALKAERERVASLYAEREERREGRRGVGGAIDDRLLAWMNAHPTSDARPFVAFLRREGLLSSSEDVEPRGADTFWVHPAELEDECPPDSDYIAVIVRSIGVEPSQPEGGEIRELEKALRAAHDHAEAMSAEVDALTDRMLDAEARADAAELKLASSPSCGTLERTLEQQLRYSASLNPKAETYILANLEAALEAHRSQGGEDR